MLCKSATQVEGTRCRHFSTNLKMPETRMRAIRSGRRALRGLRAKAAARALTEPLYRPGMERACHVLLT